MSKLINKLIQKTSFRVKERFVTLFSSVIRKVYWRAQGLSVGNGTTLPYLNFTWPHQVKIGKFCIIEKGTYFKYDGVWVGGPRICIGDYSFIGSCCEFNIRNSIIIGDNSLIASGCKFIDHDHGISLGKLINSQIGQESAIVIGGGAWLGCNVIVLKGVHIGSGSVVAAGSVVTKSIPSNEIWAGVPAHRIGVRK